MKTKTKSVGRSFRSILILSVIGATAMWVVGAGGPAAAAQDVLAHLQASLRCGTGGVHTFEYAHPETGATVSVRDCARLSDADVDRVMSVTVTAAEGSELCQKEPYRFLKAPMRPLRRIMNCGREARKDE